MVGRLLDQARAAKSKIQSQYAIRRWPNIFGRPLGNDEGNQAIAKHIISNAPFLVGRLGANEARAVGESIYRNGKHSVRTIHDMPENAGFFPATSTNLQRYAELTVDSLRTADVIGAWHSPYQGLLLDNYARKATFTTLSALEPFFAKEPWTHVLTGLRVLVVHPFQQSIISNYENRSSSPTLSKLLPAFELLTLVPPQTFAGLAQENTNWFDQFDLLKSSVESTDFDVAILGCGSYGLPLAGHIKLMGKGAIHLGGATQLLFAIKGRRWADRVEYASFFDGHWEPPRSNERIEGAERVEGACYW